MRLLLYLSCFFFFFFNDTATTEIYTLSLHDALPISLRVVVADDQALVRVGFCGIIAATPGFTVVGEAGNGAEAVEDRKSTRLNSSHSQISYAVFCLKKKKTHSQTQCIDEHVESATAQ